MKWLLASIVTITWAMWGITEKKALQSGHPYVYGIVYAIITFIINLLLYYFLYKKSGVKFEVSKDLLFYTVLTVVLLAIGGYACMFLMKDNTAWFAVATTSAYPVITLLFSVIFLHEAITIKGVIGVILVVLGVILMG